MLAALHEFEADVVLLSECGEIEADLDPKRWLQLILRICGCGHGYGWLWFRYAASEPLHKHRQTCADNAYQSSLFARPATILPHHSYRMCHQDADRHTCELFSSKSPRFPDSPPRHMPASCFPDSQIPRFADHHLCQLSASQIPTDS